MNLPSSYEDVHPQLIANLFGGCQSEGVLRLIPSEVGQVRVCLVTDVNQIACLWKLPGVIVDPQRRVHQTAPRLDFDQWMKSGADPQLKVNEVWKHWHTVSDHEMVHPREQIRSWAFFCWIGSIVAKVPHKNGEIPRNLSQDYAIWWWSVTMVCLLLTND